MVAAFGPDSGLYFKTRKMGGFIALYQADDVETKKPESSLET